MKNKDIDSHNESRLVELVTDLIQRVTILEQINDIQEARFELLRGMIMGKRDEK